MNNRQRRWVCTLQRRLEFLRERAAANLEKKPHRDLAEISAIHFALECVDLADAAGLVCKTTGYITKAAKG